MGDSADRAFWSFFVCANVWMAAGNDTYAWIWIGAAVLARVGGSLAARTGGGLAHNSRP